MRKASTKEETPRLILKRHIDVARHFGVSIDTVKNWAKQGMPGRMEAYDVGQIVRWLRLDGPWRRSGHPDYQR
jgi:phage terminase Nu1 subunit (DNA packaging protein)